MDLVYLNGDFVPLHEARISVMDRGFLFGDGIYEVVPVFGGHLFRLDQHLDRLDRSLREVRIPNPHSRSQWIDILHRLVEHSDGGDLAIYLQVTRGVGERRDHRIDPNLTPTVFASATPSAAADPAIIRDGLRCITSADIRWLRCDIKAITLLPAVLMRQQATDKNADEALLVRDGLLTEGSVTSVFAVIDETLVTPPTSHLLLPGVTRDLVLELATAHGMAMAQRDIPIEQLDSATEVWITGSTKEIAPVVEIDGKAIGDGRPGPWHRRMLGWYRDYKQHFREHGA